MPHCLQMPVVRPLPDAYVRVFAGLLVARAAGAVALLVKLFTGRKLAESVRSFAFQR